MISLVKKKVNKQQERDLHPLTSTEHQHRMEDSLSLIFMSKKSKNYMKVQTKQTRFQTIAIVSCIFQNLHSYIMLATT